MLKKLLLDTDIIIDYLRGKNEAITYLENVQNELILSVITIAELHAGIRDKEEKNILENFCETFKLIPLDRDTAILAGEIKKQYSKSHGTGLADAMIAATALNQNATLVSLNIKHYPMLNVISPYKKTN